MNRLFAAVGCLLLFSCSGSGTAPDDVLNTSVSGEPDSALFDVWTLTVSVQPSSTCPISEDASTVAQEEYRFIAGSDNSCTVDDKAADGSALTNADLILDDDLTQCSAGSMDIVLQANVSGETDGCTLQRNLIARMTLGSDGQTLSGTIEVAISATGTCPESFSALRDCKYIATVSGQKGRFAPAMDEDKSLHGTAPTLPWLSF